MGHSGARFAQPVSEGDVVLRQATVMAARLAAGRSARPILLVSERGTSLRTTLLWIGEQLSAQGHRILLIDDPIAAETTISGALRTVADSKRASPAVVLLAPDIDSLHRRTLAVLLDSLHFAAKSGFSLGCIAVGSPAILATLGSLRSFAERLIEFKRWPQDRSVSR